MTISAILHWLVLQSLLFLVRTNYTCEERQKSNHDRLNHAKIPMQSICSYHSIIYKNTNLLGVLATVRVASLLNPSSNTSAVLVSSRVSNTSRSPDAPGTVDAVVAGDQITATELEVVLVVDGPAGALRVLGCGLGAGGVADLSLACIPLASIYFAYNRMSIGKCDITYPCQTGQRRTPEE